MTGCARARPVIRLAVPCYGFVNTCRATTYPAYDSQIRGLELQ
jgi:hypothetical protein